MVDRPPPFPSVPVVDAKKMKPVGDFSLVGYCFDLSKLLLVWVCVVILNSQQSGPWFPRIGRSLASYREFQSRRRTS